MTTGTSFSVGAADTVVTGEYLTNQSHPSYDVSPDGAGFLMIRQAGEEVRTILVQNWLRELVARTSVPR